MRFRTWAPADERTAWLPWRDATRAAILRECARDDRQKPAGDQIRAGGEFTFTGLARRELSRIAHDTATPSQNPEKVLRQYVQKLAEEGELRRIGSGRYGLTPSFRIPCHWLGAKP